MSVDKLVDSTQLDADLTSVANAIRTKGGTSAQLAFPAGFVSAIGDISGGGGDNLPAFLMGTLTEIDDDSVTSIRPYAFRSYSGMTSVKLHNATAFGTQAFYGFGSATVLALPAAASWPPITSSSIQTLDMGPNVGGINSGMIQNATNLAALIIRKTSLVSLANTSQFNGTKFANGSTGGTIYIPKVLYDHLGDGTALDYKAATNWSTIDGYGTITWAQIEGSYYETHYADGTPIT